MKLKRTAIVVAVILAIAAWLAFLGRDAVLRYRIMMQLASERAHISLCGSEDWKPRPVGGPMEVRPMPRADKLLADNEAWRQAENYTTKARIYSITLNERTNQTQFHAGAAKGRTPLGNAESTHASFIYHDNILGTFKFEWSLFGNHSARFLELGDKPLTMWVWAGNTDDDGKTPRVHIIAVEGVPSDVVVGESGYVRY